jgi:hypothetical protein
MNSPKTRERRHARIKRNLLAKELERKRWRQRIKDKDYKKQKVQEIEDSYDLYCD